MQRIKRGANIISINKIKGEVKIEPASTENHGGEWENFFEPEQ
jgi:hypothetical protein